MRALATMAQDSPHGPVDLSPILEEATLRLSALLRKDCQASQLSCLWRNILLPYPSSLSGPSSGDRADAAGANEPHRHAAAAGTL